MISTSTYRIQLHDKFNFYQLEGILEYLHELRISTIYASPITRAIKGSSHGYDVTDPQQISPEIGTEEDLQRIAAILVKYNMTWIQDLVPNHMSFENSNPWIHDLLEKGKASKYYEFFDIETDASIRLLDGKLMVPFLGNSLTECLQKKEIQLAFTGEGFVIRYFQQEYPVAIPSYRWICTARPGAPASLMSALDSLEQVPCRHGDGDPSIVFDEPSIAFIREQVAFFNQHVPLSKELLDSQHYVLTHAHLAASHINYRRFFTVNSLICLRMEEEKVFSAYHRQIRSWYEKGYIQGFRLDHIDGLAAPHQYIQQLRQTFGEDCYIVAEKILAGDEPLPADWQLQGTTGYEFLAAASQLLTDPDGFRALQYFYREKINPGLPEYKDLVFERKLHFLHTYMGGELDNLVRRAASIITVSDSNVIPGNERNVTLMADVSYLERLKNALAIFMSSFPVYRLYPETTPDAVLPDISVPLAAVPEDDRPLLQKALTNAGFLARLMQFTGPLAAKGVEDTVFYVYNALIARNEVGDSPSITGLSAAEFHRKMILRQKTSPHSMNAGTTHDTKRGEDSRMRLCWLTAIPDEWIAAITRWREMNKHFVKQAKGRPSPSPNDEYFIYQSLLGAFPPDMTVKGEFRQRFHDMLTKALREARTATSWDHPDETYEKNCHVFVDAILDTESPFMEDFMPFAYKCMQQGARYSLSQLLLRLTAPGIPDIYQGSECWDLSLVDPDNRRPVDYAFRRQLLQQLKEEEKKGGGAALDLVSAHQQKGAGKMYTLYKTLAYRNSRREVFAAGEYIPLDIPGAHLAFIRRHGKDWALVVVPLIRMSSDAAGELSVILPEGAPGTWTDIFTDGVFQTSDNYLGLDGLLEKFPVALLTGHTG